MTKTNEKTDRLRDAALKQAVGIAMEKGLTAKEQAFFYAGFEECLKYTSEGQARVEKAKEALKDHLSLRSDTKFGYDTLRLCMSLIDALEPPSPTGCTDRENEYYQAGWQGGIFWQKNQGR